MLIVLGGLCVLVALLELLGGVFGTQLPLEWRLGAGASAIVTATIGWMAFVLDDLHAPAAPAPKVTPPRPLKPLGKALEDPFFEKF